MSESSGDSIKKNQFGTLKGVFVPSILTIFGVIMYLRLGWVAGNAGLAGTIVIVTLSSAITLVTALSISSIATNMKIGAGGAYYMISRSFGLEMGAAIGIPLFFAQALGISFYISGFAESLHLLIPDVPTQTIAIASLLTLTALAFFSANLVLKTQLLILLVIIASLVSFFMGKPPTGGFAAPSHLPETVGFWAVFAVFFPAVTGIETGVAMSGDLKKPSFSLPVGTLAAVIVGYIAYIAIPIFLISNVPIDTLRTDNSIFQNYAREGTLVIAGIWGATLSSALGSLLGAPRTLQAIAADRILPAFLGKGFGPGREPRIATVAACIIALGGVMLGDLNAIAPVLSMFFLTSYGFLNLATAFEGRIGSPSWRPTFKTHWFLSFLGSMGCFAVMLMIDAGATFVAAFLTACVYWVTKQRKLSSRWADLRRGILQVMARFAIYRLDEYVGEETKTWRPNLLVLSGAPTSRWHLIEMAHSISHGKGFLTVAALVPREGMSEDRLRTLERSVRNFLKARNVSALVEVTAADDALSGARYLIRSYGMGPIYPNTILIGAAEEERQRLDFAQLMLEASRFQRNLLVLREREGDIDEVTKSIGGSRRIRVWWGRGPKNTAGLMLAIAYLLQTSPEWKGAELLLCSVVTSEEEKQGAEEYLEEFLEHGRIVARPEVLVAGDRSEHFNVIRAVSADSALVLLGLRPPTENETPESYGEYYHGVLKTTETLPRVIYTLASQDIDFHSLFS